MRPILRYWGGVERTFALNFGLVCDLEEACGKVGVGAIYVALATHQHHARYVWHTVRLGLIGGGMTPAEAEQLLRLRFDEVAWADSTALAIDLLVAINEGVEEDRLASQGEPSEPLALGSILANFAQAGIPPQIVRDMRYSDFVNLIRSLGGDRVQPPSEDEYLDMVAKYAPEYLETARV